MHDGYFYFLTDSYCSKNKQYEVMGNKEIDENGKPHSRPCYFAFEDIENPKILWMIPVSSKVEKYEKIFQEKIYKYNIKDYDGIEFGFVRGHKNAFLIQNISPALPGDIADQYIDRKTRRPVTISDNTKRKIIQKAQKLINISKKDKQCTMTNVIEMLKNINEQLKES